MFDVDPGERFQLEESDQLVQRLIEEYVDRIRRLPFLARALVKDLEMYQALLVDVGSRNRRGRSADRKVEARPPVFNVTK